VYSLNTGGGQLCRPCGPQATPTPSFEWRPRRRAGSRAASHARPPRSAPRRAMSAERIGPPRQGLARSASSGVRSLNWMPGSGKPAHLTRHIDAMRLRDLAHRAQHPAVPCSTPHPIESDGCSPADNLLFEVSRGPLLTVVAEVWACRATGIRFRRHRGSRASSLGSGGHRHRPDGLAVDALV